MSREPSAFHPKSQSDKPRANEQEDADITTDTVTPDAAYRCWKQGLSHTFDDRYLAIWEGRRPGWSSERITQELRRSHDKLAQLRQGKPLSEIRGASVLGNTPEMVERNIQRQISMFEEAVRCSGRNLSINQRNVLDDVKA